MSTTFDAALAHKTTRDGAVCRLRATKDERMATIQRERCGFYYNIGHGVYYVHEQDESELRAILTRAGFSPNEAIWE